MSGLRVQCQGCKKIMWITTDKYNPDVRPNGSMLEFLDPWKSQGWDAFDNEGQTKASTVCSMMNCPACGAALAPSGRLTVLEPALKVSVNELNIPNRDGTSELTVEGDIVTVVDPANFKFTCEVCGKMCKSLAGLKAHQRSHEKE